MILSFMFWFDFPTLRAMPLLDYHIWIFKYQQIIGFMSVQLFLILQQFNLILMVFPRLWFGNIKSDLPKVFNKNTAFGYPTINKKDKK